jgi:autotransporter translocation and assembly factor TamB
MRVTQFSLGALLALGDPLTVVTREHGVTLEDLDLRIAGGSIQGHGSRSTDETRANVELSGLDLAALIGLLPEPGPATGISGSLSAKLAIEDQGDGARGDVLLELGQLLIPEIGVPLAAELSANATPGRLAGGIQLRAAGTDSFHLDLDVPLHLGLVTPGAVLGDGTFSLILAAASDSLRPYVAAAMGLAAEEVDESGEAAAPTPRTTLGASGLVLRMEGNGHLSDPEVTLDLRLTPPPEPEVGTPVLALEGALARDLLDVTALLEIDEVEILSASAHTTVLVDLLTREVELPRADSLSGSIRSHGLDLRFTRRYLGEKTILAGLLDLVGDLSGTVESPQIRGEMTLRDAAILHQPLGLEFKEIQLVADFTEKHLVLKSATGRTRRGRLELSGGLPTPLAPEDPVELKVNATGLRLRTPEGFRAGAELDLTVGGTILHPSITGRVLIEEATIPIPERRKRPIIQLSDEDESETGATPAAPGAQGAGSQTPLDLDVTVEIPRNFWIKNKQINVEIGGELDLASRSDSLRLTGTLNTIQGRIKVAGKAFTVERGEISFYGDLELDPGLEIDAVTIVDDVTIRILLRGSARNPEIELVSEPPLPQADIFSLLLFGKRTDQLSDGEQSSLTSKAQGMAAGVATRQLQQALATQLRLDLLEIEAGENEHVTVGKYVNPRTMVRYEYEQDNESGGSGALTIEYWLTRRFEIEVTGDQRGETALDFLWRIE